MSYLSTMICKKFSNLMYHLLCCLNLVAPNKKYNGEKYLGIDALCRIIKNLKSLQIS